MITMDSPPLRALTHPVDHGKDGRGIPSQILRYKTYFFLKVKLSCSSESSETVLIPQHLFRTPYTSRRSRKIVQSRRFDSRSHRCTARSNLHWQVCFGLSNSAYRANSADKQSLRADSQLALATLLIAHSLFRSYIFQRLNGTRGC